MKRKRLLLLLPLSLVLFVILACGSCGSAPEAPRAPEPVQPEPVAPAPVPPAPVVQTPTPPAPVVVTPEPVAPAPVVVTPEPVVVPAPVITPVEPYFDPGTISEEQYIATMAEVQALIADLNRIIRARNYNAWVNHLDDSYLKEISASGFLEEKTEELYRRDVTVARNIGRDTRLVERRILRTAMDYFNYVVVPSRSNDHVDDIDFVSEKRVKAYTVDSRGTRLILYDLEIINGRWKIVS